jgi:tRNA1(Val) A37 N6-methylase TrmN6
MEKYRQPSFYHFSEDSIELVNYAANDCVSDEKLIIADFGTGSGVIAIEFALKYKNVSEIYFIELQEDFLPSLKENIKKLPKNIIVHILINKFSDIDLVRRVDIALSNPPYFEKGSGRTSQNMNKQNCRTFEIDSLDILLAKMKQSLRMRGAFYVVVRYKIESSMIREVKQLKNAIIYRNKS